MFKFTMDNKIKHIGLLIFCFLIYQKSNAQNSLDFFSLSDKYGLPQSYEIIYNGNAKENATVLSLNFPVFLNRNTIWVNSLNHFFYTLRDYNEITFPDKKSVSLNGFIMRTGVLKRLDRRTRLQVLFSPKLMSDFYKTDFKSFQPGGIFLYEKVWNKTATTGFGAMYNQELFGPFISPIVTINWAPNENWYLKATLPNSIKLNFQPSEKTIFGLNYFAHQSSYFLSAPIFNRDYIERQGIELSVFTRIQLFRHFYFEGKAGNTVARSYKQYENSDKVKLSFPFIHLNDNRVAKTEHTKNGYFLSVSIIFMMPFPEYW